MRADTLRLLTITTADVTVGNTDVATSLISTTSTRSAVTAMPANWCVAGSQIRLTMEAFVSTKSGTVGDFTLLVKYGATTIATIALTTLGSSLSAEMLRLEVVGTIRTTGGTGTIEVTGICLVSGATPIVQKVGSATPVTIATNAAATFDVTGQWATADASNTITVSNVRLEFVGPKVN